MPEAKKADTKNKNTISSNLTEDEKKLIKEMRSNKNPLFEKLILESEELDHIRNSTEFTTLLNSENINELINSDKFLTLIESAYKKIDKSKKIENFSKEAFIIQLYEKRNGGEDKKLHWIVNKKDTNILSEFRRHDKDNTLQDEEISLLELIIQDKELKNQIEDELKNMGINKNSFDPENLKNLDQYSEDVWVLQLYQKIFYNSNLKISWEIKSLKDATKDSIILNKVEEYNLIWDKKFENFLNQEFTEKHITEDELKNINTIQKKIKDWIERTKEEKTIRTTIKQKFVESLPDNEKKEYLYKRDLKKDQNSTEIYSSCIFLWMENGDLNNNTEENIESIYYDALKYNILSETNTYILDLLKNNDELLNHIVEFFNTTKENFLGIENAEALVSALSDFSKNNPDLRNQNKELFDFFANMKNMVAELKENNTSTEYLSTIKKHTSDNNSISKKFDEYLKTNAETYMLPLSEEDRIKYIKQTGEVVKKLGEGEIFNKMIIDMNSEYKSIEWLTSISDTKSESSYLPPEILKSFMLNDEFTKCKNENEKRTFIAKQIIKNVLYVDFWYDPNIVKEECFNLDNFDFGDEKNYQEFLYKMNYLNPLGKIKELKKYIKDEKILKYLNDKEEQAKKDNEAETKYSFDKNDVVKNWVEKDIKSDFYKNLDTLALKQNVKLDEAEKEIIFNSIKDLAKDFENITNKWCSFVGFVFEKIFNKLTSQDLNKTSKIKLSKLFGTYEVDEKWNRIYDGLGNPKKNTNLEKFFGETKKIISDCGYNLYRLDIGEKSSKEIKENLDKNGQWDDDIKILTDLRAMDEKLKNKKSFNESEKRYIYKKFIQKKLETKLVDIKNKAQWNKEIENKIKDIEKEIDNLSNENIEQNKNNISNKIDNIAKQLNIEVKAQDLSSDNFEKIFTKFTTELNSEWSIINQGIKKLDQKKIETEKVREKNQEIEKNRTFDIYSNHYANSVIKKENPKEFEYLKSKWLVKEQDNFLEPVSTINASQNLIQGNEMSLPQKFDYQWSKIVYSYNINWKDVKEEIKELTFEDTNKEFLRRFLGKNWFDINILKGTPDEFKKNFGIDITQRLEPKHLEKVIFIITKFMINKIDENIWNCSRTEQDYLTEIKRNMILNPNKWLKQFLDFLNYNLAQNLKIYTNDVNREIKVWTEFKEWENEILNLKDFFDTKRKDLASLTMVKN